MGNRSCDALRMSGGKNLFGSPVTAPHKPLRAGAASQLAGIRRPLALGLLAGCAIALLGSYMASAPQPPMVGTSGVDSLPRTPASIEAISKDSLADSLPEAPLPTVAPVEVVIPEEEENALASYPTEEITIDEFVVRAAPRIELETSDMWVSSRAVAAVIVLKRTGSKQGPARVRWKTMPGTATPAKDYESKSSTVKFADGQTTRTVFVPLTQQSSGSDPRTFSIVLERAPSGSALGSITSTTVTILGDS